MQNIILPIFEYSVISILKAFVKSPEETINHHKFHMFYLRILPKHIEFFLALPFQSPTPPQYVYWQKNDRMINYDDSRRDISIDTTPGPRTQSRLIIREPQISDSGNYTCSASNTEPASIFVFVSKGKSYCELLVEFGKLSSFSMLQCKNILFLHCNRKLKPCQWSRSVLFHLLY